MSQENLPDQFSLRIFIQSPRQKVFKSWATPMGLTTFFLAKVAYYNNNIIKENSSIIEKDNTYEWYWYGSTVPAKGRVIEIIQPDSLKFTFGKEEEVVSVIFTEPDGKTLVKLTQDNLHKDVKVRHSVSADCIKGWSFYLTNLKSVLEGGIDLREKSPDGSDLINW